MEYSVQSDVEIQVRNVLIAYKTALVRTNYGSAWHRLFCRLGEKDATKAESDLMQAETNAQSVVNSSEEHKRLLRVISSQQPDFVRDQDRFLDLIQKA